MPFTRLEVFKVIGDTCNRIYLPQSLKSVKIALKDGWECHDAKKKSGHYSRY